VDFLDKALEKAKAARPQAPEAQTPAAPGVSPPRTPPPLSGAGAAVGEIHYTTTRTLPVNAAWLQSQRIVTGASDDKVGEAYKHLRTQIVQRTRAENKNLLMVTGPLANEGKTLTAINLAISLSQEVDKTVLLVDADLRRPTVHDYLGCPGNPAWWTICPAAKPSPNSWCTRRVSPSLWSCPGAAPLPRPRSW
jgi:protein-tyrosine kinase